MCYIMTNYVNIQCYRKHIGLPIKRLYSDKIFSLFVSDLQERSCGIDEKVLPRVSYIYIYIVIMRM